MTYKTSWLCQCGNGLLGVSVDEIPEHCNICGFPTPAVGREEALDWWGLECVDYEGDENGH